MRSYSIALLLQAETVDHERLIWIDALRRALPFASMYLYCDALDDGMRSALQKLDVVLRPGPCGNRFRLVRRMFTEVDADVFAYLGAEEVDTGELSQMIHRLVEERKDMVIAHADAPQPNAAAERYGRLCAALYGVRLCAPLSRLRVFSRRFVKSFAAYERGFPIELEWSIHALELDIPYEEHAVQSEPQPAPPTASPRRLLSHLILHLQARPLKWFGLATGLCLLATLFYKVLFCLNYLGFQPFVDATQSAVAAGILAIASLICALSGLALHSISHQRRELKRLHFQQHSTL